ncbi:hypothetical protein MBLNU230_g8562t1 [Neophaeotheca triangularis]
MADPKFINHVCLITGAASGIGRATALKMASHAADLFLTDIDSDRLEEVKIECRNFSKNCQTDIIDVSNTDHIRRIQDAVSKSGVDFVFNCAGVNPTAIPLTETTDAYYDKLMNTNLRGTYNVTRACMPHMRPGGSFVNVSSIMGVSASANMAIYCATKWGIVGFTKAMALELGPKGLRCNAVAPGYINTPTNAGVLAGGDEVKLQESRVAMGRMGTPDEVADVVAFLFSDEARYMNGSIVEINGGR